MRVTAHPSTGGGDGVDLIQEDHRGCSLPGLAERLSHCLLRLAHPLAQELRAFDADEVGLALRGYRFGEHGLARSRRAVEQDSSGRLGVHVLEEPGIGKGPLHRLYQLLLDLSQSADLIPMHIGGLDHHLTHGRRLHLPQGCQEVLVVDLDLIERLHRYGLDLQVDLRQHPADGAHSRLPGQSSEIRSHESVGYISELLLVHVLGQGHSSGVDLQYLQARLPVGNPDLNLPVEPSRPAQGWIDGVRPVGSSDDHHFSARLHAVHQSQKLSYHPALHLARYLFSLGGDGVDLIDEDDRRCLLFCRLEQLAELLLRLAIVLGHDLRAAQGLEVGIGL